MYILPPYGCSKFRPSNEVRKCRRSESAGGQGMLKRGARKNHMVINFSNEGSLERLLDASLRGIFIFLAVVDKVAYNFFSYSYDFN